MTPAWRDTWFAAEAHPARGLLWRGVEAQHRVATMRLVDSLDEQAELERILEASKPPLPRPSRSARTAVTAAADTVPPHHYLLGTPFRYRSPHPSRFRVAGDPGLWYGARERETACAEVAYWRWRFLMDSTGLRDGVLITEHTLFQAQARGLAIDLTRTPWSASARAWTHPSDYTTCQSLTHAARSHGVQWIRYASVRRPAGHCAVVLAPDCLSIPDPPRAETWLCKVSATQALMLHEEDRLTFALGD
ncbi:MAG: RES family NAD+ phosphorylase [Burkholderiaceae bacterium]|nr:RES family NAD+ phosphorylase [Burkholderiaceae bacterium]